jgi:hypothetical protein
MWSEAQVAQVRAFSDSLAAAKELAADVLERWGSLPDVEASSGDLEQAVALLGGVCGDLDGVGGVMAGEPPDQRRSCPGHARHWFSVHGQAYLRSPVCVRCGEPNPRKLSDDEMSTLADFDRHFPMYIGRHAHRAVEAWRARNS